MDPLGDDTIRNPALTWELLQRHLAGETSADEARRVEALLAQRPLIERLTNAYLGAASGPAISTDVERARQAFWARYHATGPTAPPTRLAAHTLKRLARTSPSGASTRRRATLWQWSGIVTFAVGAICTFGYFAGRPATAVWPSQMYRTAAGQQTTIHLADGSTIMLAPETRLQVTPTGVDVQGEALFRIGVHPTRMLTVSTIDAVAQVLGTTFTVRRYAGDRGSRITVVDGKVMMHTRRQPERPVILAAHMMGQSTDSGVSVTTGITSETSIGWTQGRLVFRDAPVGDVVVALARAYGVDIQITDTTLTHQPITLTASVTTQSLAHVLDFLTRAIGAHYTRTGQAFVIVQGRTPDQVPRSLTPFTAEVHHGK